MVGSAPLHTEYLYNFNWRVLDAPEEAAFVTSDNPLVKVSTERLRPPYNWRTGWETPWMEATSPVEPSTCLLISVHHPPGREAVASDVVREINVRTAKHSQNQVYSSKKILCQEELAPPSGWEWWSPVTEAMGEDVPGANGKDRGGKRPVRRLPSDPLPYLSPHLTCGYSDAGGGTRTLKGLLPPDFESDSPLPEPSVLSVSDT